MRENPTTALTAPAAFAAWAEEATEALVGEARRRNLAEVHGPAESTCGARSESGASAVR